MAAGLFLGCGQTPSEQGDSGAKTVAREFLEALVRKDWPQAYSLLNARSRTKHRPEEFRRLAETYRAGLGFEPTAVHVRACEDQGERAIAHFVWAGRRNHRDALPLLREGGEWGVVLPAQFGRPRPTKKGS